MFNKWSKFQLEITTFSICIPFFILSAIASSLDSLDRGKNCASNGVKNF